MFLKIKIVLVLALGHFSSASFFGLFSSPTRKPDVIVSDSPKSSTDRVAYQNYLRSLAETFYQPSTTIRLTPFYTYGPRVLNANFIQPQQNVVYEAINTPRILQKAPVQFPLAYSHHPIHPIKTKIDSQNSILGKPIVVLPSSSNDETPVPISGGKQDYDKLTKDSAKVETYEFKIPEPQISATLYDLPVSGISPDFRTGGYITKMIKSSSTDVHSSKNFGHSYNNGDGTKVSENGQVVKYGNGQETVLKQGHYEYIDANGKPISVNWVADDNGFRLVK